MPREEERLRKIRDIMLKHKGKANAITSRELMNKLGFTEGETYSITRSLLMKATKSTGCRSGPQTRNHWDTFTSPIERNLTIIWASWNVAKWRLKPVRR